MNVPKFWMFLRVSSVGKGGGGGGGVKENS